MSGGNFNFIMGIIVVIFIITGTAGNLVSFLTWTMGTKSQKFTGTMYLRVLALSDTLVLYSSATEFAVFKLFKIHLRDMNDIPCKLYDALGHFGALMSTWIIVSLTIQRTVAYCLPRKTDIWDSKGNEIIVITVFFMLFLFLNLSYGLAFSIVSEELHVYSTESTTVRNFTFTNSIITSHAFSDHENSSSHMESLEPVMTTSDQTVAERVCLGDAGAVFHRWHELMIDVCLLLIAPFTLLILCCVILLVFIVRRKDAFGRTVSQYHEQSGEKGSTMTACIVTIGMSHCVLVGPYAIAGLVQGFSTSAHTVLHVLYFFSHSIKYVYYSLIGTTFRKDRIDLSCKTAATEPHGMSETIMSESKF